MAKKYIIAFLTLSLSYLVIGLVVQRRASVRVEREFARQANTLQSLLPTYLKIQATLSQTDVFGSAARKANAGVVLNRRVRWLENGSAHPWIDNKPEGRIPPFQKSGPPPAWDQARKTNFTPHDFSWLGMLAKYDHWDLSDAPPIQNALARWTAGLLSAELCLTSAPKPVFADISSFARMRLLHGLAKSDLQAALRDVRNLARLAASTETHDGFLHATVMLGYEAQAYDHALQTHQIQPGSWVPIREVQEYFPEGSLEPVSAFFGIHVPKEILEETVRNPQHSVGRCLAIAKGTTLVAQARYYLTRQFPGEENYSMQLKLLQQTALDSNAKCHHPLIRKFWEEELGATPVLWMQSLIAQLPYFRRVAAARVLVPEF